MTSLEATWALNSPLSSIPPPSPFIAPQLCRLALHPPASSPPGAGGAELGEALDGTPRPDYVLATKCFWPMRDNANTRGLQRNHIFEAVAASLRRLRADYIDLYQCPR